MKYLIVYVVFKITDLQSFLKQNCMKTTILNDNTARFTRIFNNTSWFSKSHMFSYMGIRKFEYSIVSFRCFLVLVLSCLKTRLTQCLGIILVLKRKRQNQNKKLCNIQFRKMSLTWKYIINVKEFRWIKISSTFKSGVRCVISIFIFFWYMKYRVYYPLIGHADLIEC